MNTLLRLGIAVPKTAPPPEPNREQFPFVGQMHFYGIPILIENLPGDVRSGTDKNGVPWAVAMNCVYGEIAGTHTVDGDPLDVFVGEDFSSQRVFVISQFDPDTGDYDEDKVMLGFPGEGAAVRMYEAHSNRETRFQTREISLADFKQLLNAGDLALGVPVPMSKSKTYKVPAGARNNAKKVLEWKRKHGKDVKGMTEVGWARARQLATQDAVSLDTVKRMAAFNRHRKNAEVAPEHKDEPWKDRGYVAWLGWGGTTGVDWARGVTGALSKSRSLTNDALLLLGFADDAHIAAVEAGKAYGITTDHPGFEDVLVAAYTGVARGLSEGRRDLVSRLAKSYALYAAGGHLV